MMRRIVVNAVAGRIANFPFRVLYTPCLHFSQKRPQVGGKARDITWGYVARNRGEGGGSTYFLFVTGGGR